MMYCKQSGLSVNFQQMMLIYTGALMSIQVASWQITSNTWIAVCQKWADREKNFGNSQSWAPVIF